MMKKELIDATKANMGISTYDALFVHEIAFPDELYFNRDFLSTIFDVFGFVAQHMHMPRVSFIALSSVDQEAASLIDYEEIGRTIYSIYKVGNTRPFDILRELDEMYALLFELAVSPVLKYIEMPGFEEFHEALDARLAKEAAEKRHDDDIWYVSCCLLHINVCLLLGYPIVIPPASLSQLLNCRHHRGVPILTGGVE